MNLVNILPIISKFNNVPHVELMEHSDIIVINFKEYPWRNTFLSTLQTFDKIVYDKPNTTRPFIKALKKYYHTEDLVTVFLLKSNTGYLQQNILIGNNKLLIPVESYKDANIHLVLLPMFCDNDKKQLRKLKNIHLTDNMHFYKSHVLFLDPYQIPYPGGSYYAADNVDLDSKGDYKRMCIITKDLTDVHDNAIFELYQISRCLRYPLYTKSSQLKLPDLFFLESPVEGVHFEEGNLINSALITKTFSTNFPEFLLQDILNTYHNDSYNFDTNPFPLKSVALFIQYPVLLYYKDISYLNSSQCSLDESRYYLFFINSLNPQKIIHVKHPYDRYYLYENMNIEDIHSKKAMMFYYIPNHLRHIPYTLERVIMSNVMLGYKYKNKFLCLSYPMLIDAPRIDEYYNNEKFRIQNSHNYNTDCLLNVFHKEDFITHDINLKVLGIYNIDENYDIYKVNHIGCRNDTWCLVSKLQNVTSCSSFNKKRKHSSESNDESTPKYYRRAVAPLTSFVAAWVDFFSENIDKKFINYGNLNVFKLAMVLARHKICFKMRVAESRKIGLLNRNEYVFYMDQPAINFVNDMRLLITTEQNEDEEEEYTCVIT